MAECSNAGVLKKVLLLQHMEGISDREAEARARYDLRWKQALRVPIDEAGFKSSTLSVFRTRLLVNGLEAQVFQRILETAATRGLISQETAVQVVDSTYTLGAGAAQDTYTLLCTVIRKLLRVLNQRMDFTARLAPGLRVDYGGKCKKPKIDWNDPEAKQRLLSELVANARQVLAATAGLELTAAETRLVELLGVVATQDVSEDEAGRVVLKQGVAKDRVISATDPELRHGRKSRARKFDGYQTHPAVEVESEFITSVATTSGNVHDSEAATQLVDAQPPEQRPQVLIGDSAYGTGQVRAELAEHQVQVVAPVPEGPPPAGRFPKSEFTIDLVAGTCRCPAGELRRSNATAARDGCKRLPSVGAVRGLSLQGPVHAQQTPTARGNGARS
ncbi:MAG: transposase [Bacillota bacterium]